MQHLSSLSIIVGHYDALLLDLWGVVHDGSQLYPGVHEVLTKLRAQGKKIIMLSNAPRRAQKAAKVLTQLGIEPALYDQVITSGELGYQWLAQFLLPLEGGGQGGGQLPLAVTEERDPHLNPPPFRGRRYFYIGPSKDADVLDGLDYQRADDIKQCDFVLNVGFGSEEEQAADFQPLLRAAKGLSLPMLCLNPDLEVVKITGERFACAGVLAADYERMGGKVQYFGKPFPEVYAHCMKFLGLPKEKILAVGDGIATDIAGAVGYGIDAVLITGGIFKKQADGIEELCRTHKAVPQYVMPALIW